MNDPLNPGMSEEEALESGVMIDVTEEDVGFVITPTIPDGTDRENKSGETDMG